MSCRRFGPDVSPTSRTPRRVAARLQGVPRSGIREIMELAAGMSDVIRLEVGEPDFDTPGHVVAAAAAAAASGATRYTSSRGIAGLREAAAEKLARVNGVEASADSEILVVAGAANGLLVTLAAVLDPGDTVLVPDPGWPNYVGMASMLGLRVERYAMRRDDGFQPDVEQVARLVRDSGVRALVLNSPHNPTGTVVGSDRLQALLDVAAQHGVVAVSDECYDQIVLDGDPARTPSVGELVHVHSLSKTYAMTGWRIGYLSASAGRLQDIARIQETWLSCCSAPVQHAAEAALRGDQRVVGQMVAAYRERRDAAMATAAECQLRVHRPAGAFYMMVDVTASGMDGTMFARHLLERAHVATAPGETFGSQSGGMVRVSLAASVDRITTGLQRLSKTLDEAAARS